MGNSPSRFIAPLAVALAVATLIYSGTLVLGNATMAVIGGSAVIAYFVWLVTAWRRPIDPSTVTLPYLALIAMELVHMGEEQLTDFPGSLRRIFPIPHSFNLVMHAVLLMGVVNAVALLAALGIRSSKAVVRQVAGYIMWFYVIGPGMVNAVAHVTFPFVAQTLYFSGLITVILPTVAGIVTLIRLLQSDARARSNEVRTFDGGGAFNRFREGLIRRHRIFGLARRRRHRTRRIPPLVSQTTVAVEKCLAALLV